MTAPVPELRHVSWSQAEKFRLCKRRWWYSKKRPDIVDPPTEALTLGNECHEIAEAHYEDRTPRGLRYITHDAYESTRALLADPRLPKRTDDIRVEYPRDRDLGFKIAGVPVLGRMDLLLGVGDTHLVIYDWKTLSNWKNAKSSAELAEHGQPNIYGAWAFGQIPTLQTVEYVHGQILTSGVDYDIVRTRPLVRGDVAAAMKPVEADVREMAALFPTEKAEDVPCDTTQCWAFRRPCPYASICPKAPISRALTPTHPEGAVMSLADRLKKRAAEAAVNAAPAATPAPAAAPEPEATAAPAPAALPPSKTRKAKASAAEATATPSPAPGATTVAAPPDVLKAKLVIDVGNGRQYVVELPVKALEVTADV